jgi:hypothetical protein
VVRTTRTPTLPSTGYGSASSKPKRSCVKAALVCSRCTFRPWLSPNLAGDQATEHGFDLQTMFV